jgi:hypothetical protein
VTGFRGDGRTVIQNVTHKANIVNVSQNKEVEYPLPGLRGSTWQPAMGSRSSHNFGSATEICNGVLLHVPGCSVHNFISPNHWCPGQTGIHSQADALMAEHTHSEFHILGGRGGPLFVTTMHKQVHVQRQECSANA